MSLALADLVILVILAVNMVTNGVMKCHMDNEDYYFAHFHVSSFIVNVALFTSVWITVLLAFERFIAICHPMKVSS